LKRSKIFGTLNESDFDSTMRFKVICLFIFLFPLSQQIHAQKKNIIGAMIGANVSRVTGYDGKTLVGLTGGLYWEWKFAKSFSLQSNFLYSQRGELDNDATSELRLEYINLPIMAKYYVTDKFQVMTGVFWDFLIGVDSQVYSKDDIKSSDFGIPLGLSYDLFKRVQFGLSVNFGLTNISNSDKIDASTRNNWGNLTVAFLLR
jgi:hypothetical protein